MVFVHSRKDTGGTARALIEAARQSGELALLSPHEHPQFGSLQQACQMRGREG